VSRPGVSYAFPQRGCAPRKFDHATPWRCRDRSMAREGFAGPLCGQERAHSEHVSWRLFACAAALAAWDRHILSNRHALLEVEGELKRVSAGQDALERKLYMLETHQKVRAHMGGGASASAGAGAGRGYVWSRR